MLPTSLPGGIPGGITAARPTSARAASLARVGIDATSSGVFPSSAATGRSAQPSGTHTTYFTGCSLAEPSPVATPRVRSAVGRRLQLDHEAGQGQPRDLDERAGGATRRRRRASS